MKEENTKQENNRYKCLKLLGEGTYGKAFLVECPDYVILLELFRVFLLSKLFSLIKLTIKLRKRLTWKQRYLKI